MNVDRTPVHRATFQTTRTTERRGSVFCKQEGRRGVLCAHVDPLIVLLYE